MCLFIQVRQDLYEAEGILEEALIHEGAHTSLDSRHASSSGWIQAQQDDMDFISTYARDYPTREDLAESFPMWMALRYREDKILPRLAETIRARMPHRLVYLGRSALRYGPGEVGDFDEQRQTADTAAGSFPVLCQTRPF